LALVVTRSIENIGFWGGDLALDFANTLEGARGEPPDKDHLHRYADLVTWAWRAGALPEGARLKGADLTPARQLRQAIYDVFSALAAERQPPKTALRTLSTVYAGAVENGVLAAGPQAVAKGFVDDWDWVWAGRDPDRPLWPIAVAAVDLLRSDRLGRLKMCGNCRWLFLDRSRNGSRRWCSMDECGVHTKMRRYRARKAA
jgi:predicted RNA-binding Zn ribbon-like protein